MTTLYCILADADLWTAAVSGRGLVAGAAVAVLFFAGVISLA